MRLLLICALFLASFGYCAAQNTVNEVKIIHSDALPEPKKIERITGKGLVEFATFDKQPEVLFETKAKIRSAILINDGALYFGNEQCEFYAVDLNTKQQLWMYSTDESVQTWPVFADGKIVFNSGNSLYVLDAKQGNEICKITYPSAETVRVSDDMFAFSDSYVAVADDVACYAALNGDIVAVDIKKGDICWSIPAENSGVVASGVNISDRKLYFSDCLGSLCCVDMQTKQPVFQTRLQDRIFAPMYINEGKIYVAGRSCKVYCVDAENGNVLWSSFSNDTTTWFSGGSTSVGNTLYTCTSDEHTLAAFNKNTGEFLRLYPTAELNAYTTPMLHGENVIVAATDVYSFKQSAIMEFDTKNHTKLWQTLIDDCVLSPPAIDRGALYFGSDSGIIYRIKLIYQ